MINNTKKYVILQNDKLRLAVTESFLETKNLGEKMAKRILKNFSPRAIVVGLIGELGGGKTTFLQGFAKGLGIKEKILSPSFVILKRFKIPDCKTKNIYQGQPLSKMANRKIENQNSKLPKFKNFYHLDCYRVEKEKEILALGFKEIIFNSENIVCIEWADRIKKILPPDTLFLTFEFIDAKTRKIELKCQMSKTILNFEF